MYYKYNKIKKKKKNMEHNWNLDTENVEIKLACAEKIKAKLSRVETWAQFFNTLSFN